MSRVDLAENMGAGNGADKAWPGGRGYFVAEATWGGGNAKLQFQTLRGTWIDVPTISLTANGAIAFDVPPSRIRTVVTTSTGVYAYAVK